MAFVNQKDGKPAAPAAAPAKAVENAKDGAKKGFDFKVLLIPFLAGLGVLVVIFAVLKGKKVSTSTVSESIPKATTAIAQPVQRIVAAAPTMAAKPVQAVVKMFRFGEDD